MRDDGEVRDVDGRDDERGEGRHAVVFCVGEDGEVCV